MHILLLPSFYPTPKRPSLGVFFRDQVKMLQAAGHQVGVLVMPRIKASLEQARREGKVSLAATRETDSTGAPIYRMHWGWFPRMFPRICAALSVSAGRRAFEQYCAEQGKPDLIHAHNTFYSGYLAVQLKREHGIPVVLTEHSTNFLRGRIFLPGQHWVARETLRDLDAAFAVGPALAAALNQFAPEQTVNVIANVVDTDFFTPDETELPTEPFHLAAVAHLVPRKGFDTLLRAFAATFQGEPARLSIGGDGVERVRLETLRDELNLRDQVDFLGYLKREEVRDLFRRSHVIVSASTIETFGVTLIEAMACGKPLVATRSGGPESFVTDETGILVAPGDVAALAAGLRQMKANYARYDPAAIRAACVARFSEAAIAGRLNETYQQLIATLLTERND